jgi:hypothetical protein
MKIDEQRFPTPEVRMHNRMIDAINASSESDIRDLVTNGRCPYPTHMMVGVPMGMFHCPICGLMVLAGAPHGSYTWRGGTFPEGFADFDVEAPVEGE